MRAAVVLCLAVMAMSASAYREYARTGALEAQGSAQVHGDDAATRLDIATRKATCPFVGSAVNMALLPVTQHNPNGAQPLASIDTVTTIGNTPQGSTLGHVLKVFSTGNHAKMLGTDGKLSENVPAGTFALDFPGSQGAHAGHSGILMGDPHTINSGRWSAPDWTRFMAKASGGVLTTAQIGAFIGENVAADPKSKTITDLALLTATAADTAKLVAQLALVAVKPNAQPEDFRAVISGITKLAADDNLIGSAGEFGLLLAFLEHSPTTIKAGHGNTFSVADITDMFQHKRFPAGWDTWQKSALSWAKYSTELTVHARLAYNAKKAHH